MSDTTMFDQIGDTAGKLFSAIVDKAQRETVEKGQWPAMLWQRITEVGFDRALAAEDHGGIGIGWADAYPILRGLGYWQVPLPVAETMIAAQLLSMAGIVPPDGPLTVIEQGLDDTLTVDGDTLSGTAQRVPWARHCAHAVVSTADGRIGLVALTGAAGVTITHRANHAGEPLDGVAFAGVRFAAVAANPVPALDAPVWTLGAIARSAMMVGALEFALEQSVQYANDRVQFGKPIGKNQAIQQQLAVLAGDMAAARMAALIATQGAPSLDARDAATTTFDAAVAKVRVGESATRATSIAHQTHGAIGFTQEHALHFATRRLWAWRESFGSDGWWAQRLGRAAIAAGSKGYWAGVTQRRFAGMPASR